MVIFCPVVHAVCGLATNPSAGQLGGVRGVLGGDVGVGRERVRRLGVGPQDGLLGTDPGDDRRVAGDAELDVRFAGQRQREVRRQRLPGRAADRAGGDPGPTDEAGRGVTGERRVDENFSGVIGEQEGRQAVLEVGVLQEVARKFVLRLAWGGDGLPCLAPRRGHLSGRRVGRRSQGAFDDLAAPVPGFGVIVGEGHVGQRLAARCLPGVGVADRRPVDHGEAEPALLDLDGVTGHGRALLSRRKCRWSR